MGDKLLKYVKNLEDYGAKYDYGVVIQELEDNSTNDFKIEEIEQRYRLMDPFLNERTRRLFAAGEAMVFGRGGVALLSRITGLARNTIMKGCRELKGEKIVEGNKVRKSGGGRKSIEEKEPQILKDLDKLMEPFACVDYPSVIRWSTMSNVALAKMLQNMGYAVSANTIPGLLNKIGYIIARNRQSWKSSKLPEWNQRFWFIKKQTEIFQNNGQPVIFSGKVNNSTHIMECVNQWYFTIGQYLYPEATRLLMVLDTNESGGNLSEMIEEKELQKFYKKTGLEITVCYLPPGIYRWSMIKHRFFPFSGSNWEENSIASCQVSVDVIGPIISGGDIEEARELDADSVQQEEKILSGQER